MILLLSSDLASAEKERLEEKQRAARRERSEDEEEWSTRSELRAASSGAGLIFDLGGSWGVSSPLLRTLNVRCVHLFNLYDDTRQSIQWFCCNLPQSKQ